VNSCNNFSVSQKSNVLFSKYQKEYFSLHDFPTETVLDEKKITIFFSSQGNKIQRDILKALFEFGDLEFVINCSYE